jgi:CzcA family heavy metal efflux pump
VLAASLEVRGSILLATVIILLAFVPLFALDGIEGRLLEPLGIAFAVSLAASLLVALTLTPALCVWLLPGSASVVKGHEPALIRVLLGAYRPLLRWSLRHGRLLQAAALLMLLASLPAALRLGQSFLPEFNEGALVVTVTTLPGTSLVQSEALAQQVEERLLREPEVISIARRTGRAEEDEHVQGVESSELEVRLDDRAARADGRPRRTRGELLAALRAGAAEVPGVALSFGQPIGHRIDHILSGTRAALAVKIQGPDLEELRRLGQQVERLLAGVPGLVDVAREQQAEVPSLRVEFERRELARHGLSVEDAALALEFGTRGRRAGQVLEGVEAYDLVLRTSAAPAESAAQLADLPVEAPGGARLPLAAVAEIREDRTPNFISRENVQRKQVVMGNLTGGDSRRAVAEVQRRLERGLVLPPGYFIELGGQFQSAQATQRRLSWIGALVFGAIALLLQQSFRSWRDAGLVLASLPMALVGGVAGVWLSGGVLSVASLIGFICVFGVAARSGIMLVAHIRQIERSGVADLAAAVERGALERLAPILMTNLAAGLALVPIALRAGEPGNEILAPMAFVILGGLGSATLLSLALLPSLFLRYAQPAPAATLEAEDGLESDL